MELLSVISNMGSKIDYPTVITDEDLVIELYNDCIKDLIPGIKRGEKLTDYAEIVNIEKLVRSKYPSPAVIMINGDLYLCAFCIADTGFRRTFVFNIANKSKEYDPEAYLFMKLSVLSKCVQFDGRRSALSSYKRLYEAYESCRSMYLQSAGVNEMYSVNAKELFDNAFSYYCQNKYGVGEEKHFAVNTKRETVKLSPYICMAIVSMFDSVIKLSRNHFVFVSAYEENGLAYYKMTVKAKKKLCEMLTSTPLDNALSELLGFCYSELYNVKELALKYGGQALYDYDKQSNTLNFIFSVKESKKDVLRADANKTLISVMRFCTQHLSNL